MNTHKTGLTLGLFIGGLHLVWALLVALGFAQILMDWVFTWHMLASPWVVQPFSLTNAVILVVVTGLMGYAMGYLFAWVWNKVHEK